MPVILDTAEEVALWLDVSEPDTFPSKVAALLKPYEGKLECYQVVKEVGKVGNNDPEFVQPISNRKGNIASFFFPKKESSASPKKEGLDAAASTSKAESPTAKRKREATSVEPESKGNLETNAPLPKSLGPSSPSPNKKKKVDAKGDSELAKKAKNTAINSFFEKANS